MSKLNGNIQKESNYGKNSNCREGIDIWRQGLKAALDKNLVYVP